MDPDASPSADDSRRGRPYRRPAAERLRVRDVRPGTIVDAVRDFLDDHLNDWAAALTFYAGISLLPALVIVVGILGLLDDSTLEHLAGNLRDQNDGPVRDLTLDALQEVGRSAAGAGVAVLVGVLGALWSASSYVGGFLRASGVAHGRTVRYPIWKLRPLQLALSGAVIVAIAGTALFVVITGPVARDVAGFVGLEEVVAEVWDLAKWPLIVVFVLTIFAVLYWAAPDVRERGFQLVTPGGLVATGTWVVGSIAYAVYVEWFADYNRLYGTLGAVIGFLVWLWLSNMAMLYGVELNARLEREAGERAAAG
jgi:membrane protein